jgi:hypothetical protein
VAIMLNGVRVFLTGFLVYFVDPKLGEGFMHLTEGWLIFLVAFMILGGFAWLFGTAERRILDGPRPKPVEVVEEELEYEDDVEYVEVDEDGNPIVMDDAEADADQGPTAEAVTVAPPVSASPAVAPPAGAPPETNPVKPATEAPAHA